MRTEDLFKWIRARHSIYVLRSKNKPKPWTTDKILQQYRFCNVYRELDKVTVWIGENWRAKHLHDEHLWFAMVVARLFNLPDTLEVIGYPVPWRPRSVMPWLNKRKALGMTLFNGAYIVSTNGKKMEKVPYLFEHVLAPLWKDRASISRVVNNHTLGTKLYTLQSVHTLLQQYDGLGSFMAAQVIADIKYTPVVQRAQDWYTWAASGPGSRRGLNRVINEPVDAPWKESDWLGVLHELHLEIEPVISSAKMPSLHAQDLQNCLCEFDKYERIRLGEGRPKQKYPGV